MLPGEEGPPTEEGSASGGGGGVSVGGSAGRGKGGDARELRGTATSAGGDLRNSAPLTPLRQDAVGGDMRAKACLLHRMLSAAN